MLLQICDRNSTTSMALPGIVLLVIVTFATMVTPYPNAMCISRPVTTVQFYFSRLGLTSVHHVYYNSCYVAANIPSYKSNFLL